MDNETPRYAEWIPEAGGYVSNGRLLSKSPMYDAEGKFRLQVDPSNFSNTQQQNSALISQGQAASNNPISGMTTSNSQGSGTDANAAATGIGSMGSITNNTATTAGVLNTPATQSPQVKIEPANDMQKINQMYQEAVARGDLKAQIDALTEASKLDGIDRTEQINQLWQQRGDKIRRQDDEYLRQINNATTEEEYYQALSDQKAYRDMVGYDEQIERDYQTRKQEIAIDYERTWDKGISDMTNAIIQLTGNILNFQYDPYADQNLQRAQEYTRAVMTEQFANTGMYASSAVTYAITAAVAELVPVYEKMAKEEMRDNLAILQSTANYLMNLDEYQFNQWKAQIQMKWQANEEKQKEFDRAIENANARGYFTNDEAAIVGVTPGSESFAARQAAIEKQEAIEKENRELLNKMALEEFKTTMSIEEKKLQAELDDWKNSQSSYRDFLYKQQLNYEQHQYDMDKVNLQGQYSLAAAKIRKNGSDSEDKTIKETLIEKYGQRAYDLTQEFDKAYGISKIDLSNDSGASQATEIAKSLDDYGTASTDMKKILFGTKAEADISNYAKIYFGDNEEDTAKGIQKSMETIKNTISALEETDMPEEDLKELALGMYATLFDTIEEYQSSDGKDNFDYNWKANTDSNVVHIDGLSQQVDAKMSLANQGTKAKEDAMIAIIGDIDAYEDTPDYLRNYLVSELSKKGLEYAKSAEGGYAGLAESKSWKLLNGATERKPKSETLNPNGMKPEDYISAYNDWRANPNNVAGEATLITGARGKETGDKM